jgi:hypothetical protein
VPLSWPAEEQTFFAVAFDRQLHDDHVQLLALKQHRHPCACRHRVARQKNLRAIDVAHDTDQGKAEGTKVERGIHDPTPAR